MNGLAPALLALSLVAFPVFAGPVRLAYDMGHGEGTPPEPMDVLAERLGISIDLVSGPIRDDALRDVRVLYLRAPSTRFSNAEARAVARFVEAGGSLLLVLDEERRQSLEATAVNTLIAPFDMRLTDDTAYLHNCGGIGKAGEILRADREIPYSGGRAVLGGNPFAYRLDADGKPAEPFGAWSELPGGGRVIVLGEGMASLFMGQPDGERLTGVPYDPSRTTYWGKDSATFMEEILEWLAAW